MTPHARRCCYLTAWIRKLTAPRQGGMHARLNAGGDVERERIAEADRKGPSSASPKTTFLRCNRKRSGKGLAFRTSCANAVCASCCRPPEPHYGRFCTTTPRAPV